MCVWQRIQTSERKTKEINKAQEQKKRSERGKADRFLHADI